MTVLTIEKEQFFTIKGARFNKEDRILLKDCLENIQEHILIIEQNIERLDKPPIGVALQTIIQAVSSLSDSDISRMEHSLPYQPKEPLQSLRALGSILFEKASREVSNGIKEFSSLQEAGRMLMVNVDAALPDAYVIPHEDDVLLLDKQIFAACRRISQAIAPLTPPKTG